MEASFNENYSFNFSQYRRRKGITRSILQSSEVLRRNMAVGRKGEHPEWESMEPVTDEHIRIIVKSISDTTLKAPCQRQDLRDALAKDSHF